MARRDPSYRLSIVVPHLGNDARFEDSLVSVLENRPADAEVCVVHDGRYDDPFELGDEVRFITSPGPSLPEMIAAAADRVFGRFVHVIADGVRASEGWADAGLELFEHEDAGVVAPIARSVVNDKITAAGWTSTARSVVAPLAAMKPSLGRRDAAAIRGACLTASFWRRNELRCVTEKFVTTNAVAAQYVWPKLLSQAGWRCVVADQSFVIADESMLGMSPSFSQGATLRSLARQFSGDSLVGSAMAVGFSGVLHIAQPRAWGRILGEATSLLAGSSPTGTLHDVEISSPEDRIRSIRLPESATPLRRAA